MHPDSSAPSTTPRRHPGSTALPTTAEIVIIGGGPAGIEAALAAVDHGYDTILLEAGTVGASIERWQHVRLFSPWSLNRSRRGIRILQGKSPSFSSPVETTEDDFDDDTEESVSETERAARFEPGRECDPETESDPGIPSEPARRSEPAEGAYLTGREYIDHYLLPLAQSSFLDNVVHEHVRVISASRRDALKADLIGDPRRGDSPFRILWETEDTEGVIECRYLIDASGVYEHPNWTGAGGGPAPGERSATDWITRHLPDPLGRDRKRYRGQSILVVGGGYSAATCIRDLVALGHETTRTYIDWVVRSPAGLIPIIEHDSLPERARLSEEVNRLVTDPPPFLRVWANHLVDAFGDQEVTIRELTTGHTERLFVDQVVSLTGFRPGGAPLAELQVHHCWATDGLMKVSASLLSQGSGGDCLAVESASSETLRNPEPGLFVIGSKSYGRSSQYLLRSGTEQVEAIFDELLPAHSRS